MSYLPRKDPRVVHRRVVECRMLHTCWGLSIYTQRVNRWFAQVPLALVINLLYIRTVWRTLSSMLNSVLCFNAKQMYSVLLHLPTTLTFFCKQTFTENYFMLFLLIFFLFMIFFSFLNLLCSNFSITVACFKKILFWGFAIDIFSLLQFPTTLT